MVVPNEWGKVMKRIQNLTILLALLMSFAFVSTLSFAQEDPLPEEVVACSVFFEDFEDDNITEMPAWETTSVDWELAAGIYLHTFADSLFTASPYFTSSDVLEFGFDGMAVDEGSLTMTIFGTDGNSYSLLVSNGSVDLMGNEDILLSSVLPDTDFHAVRANRAAGIWTLLVDTVEMGTVADPFGTSELDSVVITAVGETGIDNIDIMADCEDLNEAPVAEDFDVETIEDEPASFSLLDHASDPDGDELTATVLTAPDFGSLDWSEDGAVTYTPIAEWAGVVSFEYLVNDGELDSNVAVVHIIVIPVNDAPNCDAVTVDTSVLWPPNHQMVPITLDGVTDVDSDVFEITLTEISHDEDINGLGDGNTEPDWDLETGEIRAERSGLGDGRTYSIAFSADDTNWNGEFYDPENYVDPDPEPIDEGDCEGGVAVFVPHDLGGGNDPAPAPEEPIIEVVPVEIPLANVVSGNDNTTNVAPPVNTNNNNANEHASLGNNNANDNGNSGNSHANDNASNGNSNGNGNSHANANNGNGKSNN